MEGFRISKNTSKRIFYDVFLEQRKTKNNIRKDKIEFLKTKDLYIDRKIQTWAILKIENQILTPRTLFFSKIP